MALKACRECGKEVSTEAKTCPQCGVSSPTRAGKLVCQYCPAVFEASESVCPNCGKTRPQFSADATDRRQFVRVTSIDVPFWEVFAVVAQASVALFVFGILMAILWVTVIAGLLASMSG